MIVGQSLGVKRKALSLGKSRIKRLSMENPIMTKHRRHVKHHDGKFGDEDVLNPRGGNCDIPSTHNCAVISSRDIFSFFGYKSKTRLRKHMFL